MKIKHNLMSTAFGMVVVASVLAGSVQAQSLDGAGGVDMGGTGTINGTPHVSFPSQTSGSVTWASPLLQGYVVPAGQLTGINSSGTAVAYLDLLPIKASSLTVVDSSLNAGTIIDATGLETNALSLLDSGTSTLAPLSVTNGVLSVGGTAVGVGVYGNVDQSLAPSSLAGSMADIPGGTLTTFAGGTASITIEPFKMARTELTFGEWFQGLRWALNNGYGFEPSTSNTWDQSGLAAPQLSVNMTNAGVSPVIIKFSIGTTGEIANAGGHSLGDLEHPVVGVNWFDVLKWCNARSQMAGLAPVYYIDSDSNGVFDSGTDTVYKTGEPVVSSIVIDTASTGFRLPTTQEREWAARGGVFMGTQDYPWGPPVESVVPFKANCNGSPAGRTTPVGSYPAGVNPYGLHDMAGNVIEWSCDNPPAAFTQGGKFTSAPGGCRPRYRNAYVGLENARQSDIGFRLARK